MITKKIHAGFFPQINLGCHTYNSMSYTNNTISHADNFKNTIYLWLDNILKKFVVLSPSGLSPVIQRS